jgi:hypothetical protein
MTEEQHIPCTEAFLVAQAARHFGTQGLDTVMALFGAL